MDASQALGLASAGGLGVLGACLLAAKPTSPRALFFAAFVCVWAADIALFNVAPYATSRALAIYRLAFAFHLVGAILLSYFAALTLGTPSSRRWGAYAALVLGAAGIAFAFAPDLFLPRAVQGNQGLYSANLTPVGIALLRVPWFLAFFSLIPTLVIAYSRARARLDRVENLIIVTAVSLYVAYVAPAEFVFALTNAGDVSTLLGNVSVAANLTVFAIGTVILLATCGAVLWRRQRGRRPDLAAGDLVLALSILAATALGLGSIIPTFFGGDFAQLNGVMRLLTAALIAYGLLKHQIFGLDLQLKRTLRTTAPVLAFLFLALVAGAFVRALTPDAQLAGMPLFFLAGLAVGGTGAAVAVPLRARAADAVFPGVTDSTGYRRARSLEVYQAALAQAVARGAEDDPLLATLRARLGLTSTDHDVLLYVVRAEVKPEAGAAAAPPPAPEGAGARYKREKLLSEGAFANVWLAEDTTLQRKVVLKEFLRPGDPTPYDEARIASGLSHPNIVTVYDVVPEGDRASLILEYVPGGSLQARLDREGRIPEPEALRITRDILRGLHALHQRGLVHQDIKPANVLLAHDGTAKVTDFGISDKATHNRETAAAAGATLGAGAGPGTLHYMSPEQAEGTPTDPRADLYATGALLHRTLTGRFYLEFGNASEYRTRRMILEDPPRLPIDASPRVNAFLTRTLAKRPDERYANAEEALRALD